MSDLEMVNLIKHHININSGNLEYIEEPKKEEG